MGENRAEIQRRMTEWRRDFHKYAESKWTEFRTAGKIAEYLTELGIPVLRGRS